MRSSQALSRSHSSSVKALSGENISPCRPPDTASWPMPIRSTNPLTTCLPDTTPIDPVTVPGSATMASAPIETK